MKKRFFGAAMALLMLAALLPAQVIGAEDTETGGVAISEQSGESTPSSRGTISPPDATVIAALVYEDPQEVLRRVCRGALFHQCQKGRVCVL